MPKAARDAAAPAVERHVRHSGAGDQDIDVAIDVPGGAVQSGPARPARPCRSRLPSRPDATAELGARNIRLAAQVVRTGEPSCSSRRRAVFAGQVGGNVGQANGGVGSMNAISSRPA